VIAYRLDASEIERQDLAPFFEGWPTPPSLERRLAAVRGADHAAFAFDGDRLVGFATALSDGALMAYLSLLEVIASHRRRGIGTGLVRALERETGGLYGLDLCCDEEVVPFYERQGFSRVAGMVRRSPHALP
jgi:GNAT superfamily N-acetyltransferase